jgi:hypothetical protein
MRCERIVKRTLCIGFGVKRTSHLKIKGPQLQTLPPAFLRRHAIPIQPFFVKQRIHNRHS